MSVLAALQDMLATPELTHPVTLGGASTRGYLDSAGQLIPLAATELQHVGTLLYLAKDAVSGIQQGATVVVGALGADSAVGGKTYTLGLVQPIEDGLLLACQLGGGRA